VTLIFDLLTSGSLHAYGLPRLPETVYRHWLLIVQAVFLLEQRRRDRQT